jgi:Domain of unknown function (DUF4383)
MRSDRSSLQWTAWIFGFIFIAVGIAGFVPGVTTHYGDLTEFNSPGAKDLGFIGVNIVGNVIHLLYGVAGVVLARRWDGAKTYFVGGGLVYLVLWVYGLAIDLHSGANFIGVNTAANWLHFTFGLLMFAIGLVMGRRYPPGSVIT